MGQHPGTMTKFFKTGGKSGHNGANQRGRNASHPLVPRYVYCTKYSSADAGKLMVSQAYSVPLVKHET